MRFTRISPNAAFDKCNTTKTAAFRSVGNCETNSAIAFNPPADAPITITKEGPSLDIILMQQYICPYFLNKMMKINTECALENLSLGVLHLTVAKLLNVRDFRRQNRIIMTSFRE